MYPVKGVAYAEARASLLKQGLVITRDKRPLGPFRHPDRRFPEINCRDIGRAGNEDCYSLFLETDASGWRHYFIVYVDPKTNTVTEATGPAPIDGLHSIPPPLPSDVPQLKGYYLKARKLLRAQGYTPLKMSMPSNTCVGRPCRLVLMPEATCTSDTADCVSFWRAPDRRILKVETVGDESGGNVIYVSWSSREEWRIMQ